MLNPDSPIPLYHQLAERLDARILSGELSPGDRIPSETALAARYGIGRPTVRQAIEQLVRKGRLVRRRGSGTFVTDGIREVDLFSLGGTLAAFEEKGVPVESRLIAPIRRVPVPRDAENPFAGETAFFLSRISRVSKEPVLLEAMYLSPALFPDLDLLYEGTGSLSGTVWRRYRLKPTGGRQVFSIGYPGPQESRHLQVQPSAPILVVHRFLDFQDRKNAVYAELFCRTDRFVFSQRITGDGI